jgi:Dr1-associated corepressor
VSNARDSLRNIDLNLDPTDEDDEVIVLPQAQLSAPATSSTVAIAGPRPSVPRPKEGAKLKDFLGAWELPDDMKHDGDGPCLVCFVNKPYVG